MLYLLPVQIPEVGLYNLLGDANNNLNSTINFITQFKNIFFILVNLGASVTYLFLKKNLLIAINKKD